MSSSDRRKFLARAAAIGCTLPLAGCFRPMLAEESSASDLRGRISFPAVGDRLSYHLYQSLESQLGTPQGPDWELKVSLRTRERGLAIEQDNTITRISIRITADWAVFRKGDPNPVTKSRTFSESGFNSTESLYASREARLDVERRIVRDLGHRISRSVLARADTILKSA
ncbi:MAG: twin-arginine translocation signal domain-containing protein [Pseudomonadota bacterium]